MSKTQKTETAPVKAVETTEFFDLNLHIYRLLMDEPFFAALSRRINKVSTESIPTAGVWVNPHTAQFEMMYNPKFFQGLTDGEKAAVIKHEYYHLVFDHVTTRKPEDKNLNQVWNIAADLAINSHLVDSLPEFCCIPEKGKFKDYPNGKSAEWYFQKLMNDENIVKKDGKGGKGQGEGDDNGQFDSHDQWGEEDAGEGEGVIAKERLKEAMRKAADEASQSGGWGTISADTRKDILDRIRPRVDWRKVLRYFVKTSRRAHKSSTVRRVNKRYAYIHPGKKINRTANIAISIDQSGSVSDELLVTFFSELSKLAEIAEFTVIPFDHEVREDKVFVWKKGKRVKAERVSCGGTCFNGPTKYVNSRSFDGHIILTDLMAPKPIASAVQRMWMTTKEYADRPYFQTNERVVAIENKKVK